MYYVTHALLIKIQNEIVHHTLTDESLENVRVELLNDVRQRNHEVVKQNPVAREFKARWPAFFHIDEVNTCLPFPLFLLCIFSVQLLKLKKKV